MKIVTFVNFSDEDFTGFWNSEPMTIKAHEAVKMEDWRAKHYAKHLVNRELNKAGEDTHTSPKNPQDDVVFFNLYKQAVIEEEAEEVKPQEVEVALANPKKTKKKAAKVEEHFEGLEE